MKAGIHPDYIESKITCACGRVTETYATVPEIHVEICSHCHPFFTGRQKLVDTAGRVERFRRKYSDAGSGPTGAESETTDEDDGSSDDDARSEAVAAASTPEAVEADEADDES